jgi:hypothetical protein
MRYLFILSIFISCNLFVWASEPDPMNEYAYLVKRITFYRGEELVESKKSKMTIMGNYKKQQFTLGEKVISYRATRVYDDTESYNGNYTVIEYAAFDEDDKPLRLRTISDNDRVGRIVLVLSYMNDEFYFYECEILY